MRKRERAVVAFFGIRGIGSFYYLAYAATAASFPDQALLWATIGFVVIVSVVLHGVAATPVMQRVDRLQETTAATRRDA
jgi:NhaP-type Na+/H+ or K+/H+ antiporter